MALGARLRDLDARALRTRATPARAEWFRAHGWLLLLGVALAFGLIGAVLVGDVAEPGPGAAFLVALVFLLGAVVVKFRGGR